MSNSVLLTSFIDLLKKFVKDLHDAYGHKITELSQIKSSLLLFTNACPELCCKLFYKEVTIPYSESIAAKDEQFFLSDVFVDQVHKQAKENEEYISQYVVDPSVFNVSEILNTVRKVWLDMDKEDRDKVWQYLIGLTFLTKRVCG